MDRFTEYFLVWLIVGIAGILNGIIGFDRCFEKRNGNHIVYWVYFLGKAIVTSWYASAQVYRQPSMAIEVIWMVATSVFAVVSFVVLWYTWNDDPLKIGLFGVASDAISGTSMMIGALIANLSGGRGISENFLNIRLHEAVLVTAVSIILYSAAVKVLGRAIDLFRGYEIKRRKLTTWVLIAVIAGLSSSNLTTGIDLAHGLIAAYSMLVILLVLMGFLIIRRLGSQMRRSELLRSRKQMTEAYMLAIEMQTERISEQEELLTFIKNEVKEARVSAEHSGLENYVEELRAQAEDLRRGAYSGNIALDAVLSVFFERFRARGFDVRFEVGGMQDAGEKPAELSMRILSWAETACAEEVSAAAASSNGIKTTAENQRTIKYGISIRGNQYIFELDMPAAGEKRSSRTARSIRKAIREFINDNDPVIDANEKGRRVVRLMTEVAG